MKTTNSVSFAEEPRAPVSDAQRPWKILIADDEDEIHAITCLVFDNFQFEGRPLTFLSAYSGAESKRLLQAHPDIALVLLDVVMEEETSGLEVARFIREDQGYQFMRIVLRTGQPGQAPEAEVVIKYDINDYKEKTELTIPKLFTTVLGSLRAYRDLMTIDQSRQGLERIAKASKSLFEIQSVEHFAVATLTHLSQLLQQGVTMPGHQPSGFMAALAPDAVRILSGIGEFSGAARRAHAALPDTVLALLQQVRQEQRSIFQEEYYVDYFCSRNGIENVILLQHTGPLNGIEQELLKIFSGNIAVAFDNIYLNTAIVTTQKEVIFTLGHVIDTRSHEASKHVDRIAAVSHALARHAGLPQPEAELLRLASPMHDIGIIGLPDAIFTKDAPLNDEEYKIFKRHPRIGYEILKDSKQEILKTAAIIALQHQEHWDGSGYPAGLRGEAIHLFARITKLADSFDLLLHPHGQEAPWPPERIRAHLQKERERQFDPHLVDIFLEHIDEYLRLAQTGSP